MWLLVYPPIDGASVSLDRGLLSDGRSESGLGPLLEARFAIGKGCPQ